MGRERTMTRNTQIKEKHGQTYPRGKEGNLVLEVIFNSARVSKKFTGKWDCYRNVIDMCPWLERQNTDLAQSSMKVKESKEWC